jgi:hypothetical protein
MSLDFAVFFTLLRAWCAFLCMDGCIHASMHSRFVRVCVSLDTGAKPLSLRH